MPHDGGHQLRLHGISLISTTKSSTSARYTTLQPLYTQICDGSTLRSSGLPSWTGYCQLRRRLRAYRSLNIRTGRLGLIRLLYTLGPQRANMSARSTDIVSWHKIDTPLMPTSTMGRTMNMNGGYSRISRRTILLRTRTRFAIGMGGGRNTLASCRWLWKCYRCYLCQPSARGYSYQVAGWLALYVQG